MAANAGQRWDDVKRGRCIARVLAGSWRCSPLPVDCSSPLPAGVVDRLCQTGAGALGWWRVRNSALAGSPAAYSLRQAYRLHTLQVALHEMHLQEVLPALHAAGIEPLLGKGWAVARLYPEPGLRPYGDIDLSVRPGHLPAVAEVVVRAGSRWDWLDLQEGLTDLPDRTWAEAFARSRVLPLGATPVRVLGPEDQLRQLCLHFLRHGGWRPLWLCDIAVALESLPPGFDWSYFLAGDQRLTEWTLTALALADELLKAKSQRAVSTRRGAALPTWMRPTVERLWGSAFHMLTELPLAIHLRHPGGLLDALRSRWQSPIETLFACRSPLYPRTPRYLLQLYAFARRLTRVRRRSVPPPETTVRVATQSGGQ
jgi:hypothetical protein